MKKILWIVGGIVVVGVLVGLGSMRRGGAGEGEIVRVEKVAVGDLIEIVSAPGQVQPKTKVQISAKIAARIIELPYAEGAAVKKGEPLVKLDAKDLESRLRAAEARFRAQSANMEVAGARIAAQDAQITRARVQLADLEREFTRLSRLFETNDVSQQQVEQAKSKYDQAMAELQSTQQNLEGDKNNLRVMRHQMEAADAEIQQARDELSYTTILSPIDGVVTKVNAKVGELVVTGTMNNQGTVIMEVADLDTMMVKTRIDEASIASVKLGQAARVRSQAYRDQTFDGTVATVALDLTEEAKENVKYYKTEVLLKNVAQRVLSGLTADVDIETERHEKVLKVPSQAVLGRSIDDLPQSIRDLPEIDKSRSQATVVYRLIDGKAIASPVKIGASDLTHTVVLSGVKEGDIIITGPYKVLDALKHDQKVREESTTTRPADKKQ